MANLIINEYKFIFEDTAGKKVLLDCTDLLANKSRVPMHRLPGQAYLIIPKLLVKLIEKQQTEADALALPFGVLDILLVARLIRSSRPVRLLEYGSGQGELSVHLAQLLGIFHEKSSLVCAYDTIELEWMERISHVKHLPRLSFLACDFGNSGLQKNSFDIVVLNGLANFPQPCDALKEAVSLAKADGSLLCYSHDTPLLESGFKLFFETRDEYEFTPSHKVLAAEAAQCSWREPGTPDLLVTVREDLAKAMEMPADGSCKHEEYMQMLEKLQRGIHIAVKQEETALKIQLLAEKERLLNGFIPDKIRVQ